MSNGRTAAWDSRADAMGTARFLEGLAREMSRIRAELRSEAAKVGLSDEGVSEGLVSAADVLGGVMAGVHGLVGETKAWLADREMAFFVVGEGSGLCGFSVSDGRGD